MDTLPQPFIIAAAAIGIILALWLLRPVLRRLLWRLSGAEAAMREVVSQRKSSEVRTGKITEQLAPLLASFPVDVAKPGTSLVFIGQPVDYIFFDPEDGITFIEIKSGDSRLSAAQKKLKECIEDGRVTWAELRVK